MYPSGLMSRSGNWLAAIFARPIWRLVEAALEPHRVGEIIVKIGKKAGVVVNKADRKFASAHDLRRAFGTRWAKRVMPAVLKRLIRRASIQTTMGFYVDLDAADVADQLWANYGNTPAVGNTFGNIRTSGTENTEGAPAGSSAETPDNQDVVTSSSKWTG